MNKPWGWGCEGDIFDVLITGQLRVDDFGCLFTLHVDFKAAIVDVAAEVWLRVTIVKDIWN